MATNTLQNLSKAQKVFLTLCALLTVASFCTFVTLLTMNSASEKSASNTAKTNNIPSGSDSQNQGIVLSLNGLSPAPSDAKADTTNAGSTSSAPGSQKTAESPRSTSPSIGSPATKAAKTKLASVVAAENLTYTYNNRLFVTGENGIFEIIAGVNGDTTVIQRESKQNCAFGGIVESNGILYVNCSGNGAAYVYAAALTEAPSFKRIYTFKRAILPNGLTADNSNRLYVASTFFGQILRLVPSTVNPLTFTSTGVWLNGAGPALNGIKFNDNSLYWTDSQFVNRIMIKADGNPGKQTRIVSVPTIFDDLVVDNDGILIADYINGVIRSYSLNGRSNGVIRASFAGPSSVIRARAPFPAGSLIVTERASSQVTLVTF